jgi:hypothetical protein
MTLLYKALFMAICLLYLIPAQGQNGWTRATKGFYAQASLSHFSTGNYYSSNSTLFVGGSTFQSSGLLLYGEYGISNRFTAVVDIPLLLLHRFTTTETAVGTGSAKLGIKYGLIKKIPLALQVDVEIPTNDGVTLVNTKEPNSLGIKEQINLPTSDGEFNVWTTAAISKSSSSGKTFGSLYGAMNFRTESFSNQFQAGLEIGQLLFDKLYLIGKLKIQEKVVDGSSSASASFLYGEGTTFTSYGITAMYKLDSKWKIVAAFSDYTGVIIQRRNIYDGPTFSLGLALER